MLSRVQIFDAIVENLHLIVEESNSYEISEDKSMMEHGADSLETIEVVSRTMKQLGVKVSRTELSSVNNIGELVTLIQASGAKAS